MYRAIAYCTLRYYYKSLRSNENKSSTGILVAEATYGKNIAVGNKLLSSFELMDARKPSVFSKHVYDNRHFITVEENNKHTAVRRVNTMLRIKLHMQEDISIGCIVCFWRKNRGYLDSAPVIAITPHNVKLKHGKHEKTANIHRIIKERCIHCSTRWIGSFVSE